MRRSRTAALFPLGLMALLAAGSFWLYRATQVGEAAPDGNHRHDPDSMVSNFFVSRLDDQGNLQQTLQAALMLHYPDDDSTVIYGPNYTWLRNPPTHISAQKAGLDKGGKHVLMTGNVHVVRDAGAGLPRAELFTERLYAVPDDETATTDAPVILKQGNSVLQGVGLSINNLSGFSTLGGRVHGVIENAQQSKQQPPDAPLGARRR